MILKGVLLSNIKDLSNVAYMDRFMYLQHFQDTISIYGPILRRWEISRSETSSMHFENDMDEYGAYNWTMVELQFSENPFAAPNSLGGAGSALNEYFPPDYNERMGLPVGRDLARVTTWPGSKDLRPNAMTIVPLRPTEDFVGSGLTIEDGPFFRWLQLIRYPENISKDEGENWFLNVHSAEVSKMPGLKRFISFKSLPRSGAFDRFSELWFSDAESWKNAVVDHPQKFTVPKWANYEKYPFFEPFTHFVSTFVLERATQNLLRDKGIYVFSA